MTEAIPSTWSELNELAKTYYRNGEPSRRSFAGEIPQSA
jgi:hypothetical protein